MVVHEDEEWMQILALAVKIGNSFSVRIPMSVIKRLGIEEGEGLYVKLRKYDRLMSPEVIDFWFKVARKCKELDEFEDEKIVLMSRLAFNEGVRGLEECNFNSLDNKLNNQQVRKLAEFRKKYRTNIKRQYGAKILSDYMKFRRIIETAMKDIDWQGNSN